MDDWSTVGEHVASHALDDDLILLDIRNQRLFVLNDTAAFIWAGLEAGLSLKEINDEISRQTSAPISDVQRDSKALVREWAAAGLIGPRSREERPPGRRYYRVADLEFSLTGPAEAVDAAHGLLGHVEVARDSIDADSVSFTIVQDAGAWALYAEGERLGECARLEDLVPLIHASILLIAYDASECLVAIHGAAVSRGDDCVLLPGLPGAGKSTLAAALLAAGYGFCTDDLAMLVGSPLRLRALPLRLGIKSGSWSVLNARIPELATMPEYLRVDDQRIKYWLPPADRLPARGDARFRVRAIVFPRYRPGARCELVAVSRSQALLRIAEAGYHLQGRLDSAWLERALEWMSTVTCFDLEYAELDEAVAAFGEVLG